MKLLFALLAFMSTAAGPVHAGWQRDMICGGGCGGPGCDPCPTVNKGGGRERAERQETKQERADRVARQEKARRDREEAAKARKIHAQRVRLSRGEIESASRAALASATTPADVLAPGGSRLFRQGEPEPGPGVVMARAVGSIRTPASAIPLENLRRAAAVLGAVSAGLSDEDQAYLANQAADAMVGQALTVYVPPARAASPEQAEETRRFAAAAQSYAAQQLLADNATATRVAAAKALAQANVDAYMAQGDRTEKVDKRDALKKEYEASTVAEAKAKKTAKAAAKTVTYRVVPYVVP